MSQCYSCSLFTHRNRPGEFNQHMKVTQQDSSADLPDSKAHSIDCNDKDFPTSGQSQARSLLSSQEP